jgi:hypothetical protein
MTKFLPTAAAAVLAFTAATTTLLAATQPALATAPAATARA